MGITVSPRKVYQRALPDIYFQPLYCLWLYGYADFILFQGNVETQKFGLGIQASEHAAGLKCSGVLGNLVPWMVITLAPVLLQFPYGPSPVMFSQTTFM